MSALYERHPPNKHPPLGHYVKQTPLLIILPPPSLFSYTIGMQRNPVSIATIFLTFKALKTVESVYENGSFSLSHFQFFLSRYQLRVYADIVVVLVFLLNI